MRQRRLASVSARPYSIAPIRQYRISLRARAHRLAVQDVALSRRKHGFDSRWARQLNQLVIRISCSKYFSVRKLYGKVGVEQLRTSAIYSRRSRSDKRPRPRRPPAAWVRHQSGAVRQRICLIRVSSSIRSTVGAGLPSGIERSLVSLKSAYNRQARRAYESVRRAGDLPQDRVGDRAQPGRHSLRLPLDHRANAIIGSVAFHVRSK